MKIIFGLGNPEPRYDGTRHNIGFWVLDQLAESVVWKNSSKFQSLIAEASLNNQKVLLVKPQTYYNEVGRPARALADFYKLESRDILVVHDDIMLAIGKIRVRKQGSDAGNNGIKSLNAHLGQDYTRLKIGVDGPQRGLSGDTAYVLGRFNQAELSNLERLWPHIEQFCLDFINDQSDAVSLTIDA